MLFDDRAYETWMDGADYDVHPDAEHLVMIRRSSERRDVVVVPSSTGSISNDSRLGESAGRAAANQFERTAHIIRLMRQRPSPPRRRMLSVIVLLTAFWVTVSFR